jgi:hypothetical protein
MLALFAATGCGQDFKRRVECTNSDACIKVASGGNVPLIRDGSASEPTLLPQCCAGFCVLLASGCDSGYRYLNNDPAYGECVEDPMCPAVVDMPAPEPRDMSMPPRG